MGPTVEQESFKFLKDNTHNFRRGVRIEKDTEDTGHTGKVHKLRAGLVLVRVEAGPNTGKYVHSAHADAPLTVDIEAAVLLMEVIDMRNKEGDREDKLASGLIHGLVNESEVVFGTADAARIAKIKEVLPLVQFES